MNRQAIMMMSGMLAVFVYVVHVILGGMMWEDYDHLRQPISDLTAATAPNRSLMLVFTITYGVLALSFASAFTLTESRKHHKLVRFGGICFILMHLFSISYNFFPEDLVGHDMSAAGMMHIIITALIVPFTILSPLSIGLGFIKETAWRTAGILSIITAVLILLAGAASAFFYANKLSCFGLVERINIGILQLWTFYLSFQLSSKTRRIDQYQHQS